MGKSNFNVISSSTSVTVDVVFNTLRRASAQMNQFIRKRHLIPSIIQPLMSYLIDQVCHLVVRWTWMLIYGLLISSNQIGIIFATTVVPKAFFLLVRNKTNVKTKTQDQERSRSPPRRALVYAHNSTQVLNKLIFRQNVYLSSTFLQT